MRVFIAKATLHDRLGRLLPGAVVELPDAQARAFIARGVAQDYETKVMRDRPSSAAGGTAPSSASPAVPASPQTTSSASAAGGRRRKPTPDAEA